MSKQAFVAKRAMHTPMRLQTHFNVGVLCFVETHRRVLGGKFGRIPEPLKEDAFSMSGYCIDAHDLIPAGSTEFSRFGPGDDEWIRSPTTVERTARSAS